MKSVILLLGFLIYGFAQADEIQVVQISPKYCVPGVHKQPSGQFALYAFCDDALGTNISVFINDLGAPLRGAYRLTKRFWQSDEWGADVTSFAWLRNNKSLIISTSAIYGSGKVYKLDLESQEFEILYSPGQDTCVTEISTVKNGKVVVKITDCELRSKEVEIAI
jgi:hypothetical protein